MAIARGRSAAPLSETMARWRAQIDAALPGLLPARHQTAASVHEAMTYAALAPCKRIRPSLTLAVGEMYRVEPRRLIPAGCAIELVHAASLVLDDLPCMDDAATRRGRPACHVAFGESTAILAAFGLLSHAYAILAGELPRGLADGARDRLRVLLARRLSAAVGTDGIIGGQAADLEAPPRLPPEDDGGALARLEFIHSHKTGSLFIASVEAGALLSGAPREEVDALATYARDLGLAFQITDDLIDAVGDEAGAGKPVRADSGKATFVSLCGVSGARTLASELIATSIAALSPFGRRALRLEEIARMVERRDR